MCSGSWVSLDLYVSIKTITIIIIIITTTTTTTTTTLSAHGIITMTLQWARWGLKSTASLLFTQSFFQSQKKSKLRVIGLCEENSLVAGEFPAQGASNAENVSFWWRHYVARHWMFATVTQSWTKVAVCKNKKESPRYTSYHFSNFI